MLRWYCKGKEKMLILDVNKISKSFGFGQLFEDVSFSLNEGRIF